ncbi:MAG: restriction endonuclease subunit S [Opitutus sp.]
MSETTLPEGWVLTELGDMCEILDSRRIPINATERNKRISGKSDSELFPYFGATGEVGKIDGFLLDGEYVLIGEDGAPFLEPHRGVSYLVSGKFWVNNHAHILTHPTSNRFLCHYLRQIDYRPFVTGTTRLKLNQAQLRKIPLPLPPLPEQKRIVAKIEELFSELEAGEESLRKARRQLGVYRQSLLKRAFAGDLTAKWRTQNRSKLESPAALLARIDHACQSRYEDELKQWEKELKAWEKGRSDEKRPAKPRRPKPVQLPAADLTQNLPELTKAWSWISIGNCAVEISDGPFGSNLKSDDYVGSGVRVVRLENIGPDKFIEDKESFISVEKYEQLKRHTVRPGDIVVASFINDAVRAVLIPPSIEYAVNKADCFQVHCFGDTISADFLVRCFGARYFFKQLEQLVHGVGRPRINTTQLGEAFVPLCSLPEQQEIVRLLDAQFEVIERNERELDGALRQSEALRQSILKKAFTGRLVAQDPVDEPAAELLARLRAVRESDAVRRNKRRLETTT